MGEAVYLDVVDGFEFERVCQRILERLNYGVVENVVDVGDEGRDLLIHGPDGLIVVECKHQPETSIGRPVVQKLHSAVVTAHTRSGMIITSGRFSKAASDYAERLARDGVSIRLVDRTLLADMAGRAGIDLILAGRPTTVWYYAVSTKLRLEQVVAAHLDAMFESRPDLPSRLLQIQDRALDLVPVYQVSYDIDAGFETTVGVIHRETLRGGLIFLDGGTGVSLRTLLIQFFASLPIGVFAPDALAVWQPRLRPFVLDVVRIKGRAKEEIVQLHTRSVSYSGRNNQRYTKVCEPSERQFTITDIRQVYLPISRSKLRLLGTVYDTVYVEHPSGRFQSLSDALVHCGSCSRPVAERPYLCNVCGRPCHRRRFFQSHSFDCKRCQRTMCRQCSKFVRRLVFKEVLCPTCLAAGGTPPSRKIHSFAPLNT